MAGHEHNVQWSHSPWDNGSPRNAWITVRLTFHCGCLPYDPDGQTGADDYVHFRRLARELADQYGWNIATTGGWSSGASADGTRRPVTVRVRRKSMTEQHYLEAS